MSAQLIQAQQVSGKQVAGHRAASRRLGGYTAIAGAGTMVIGAILWGTSGTDLWAALDSGNMAGYLAAVAGVKAQLVVNLSLWILGVLILGIAGTMLAELSQRRRILAQVALVCFRTAVPLVIVSYIAMLAVVVQLGGATDATAVAIANVVGWIGARADDLATALIIGGGPLFVSLAGHGDWVPTWLLRWGYVAGLAGLFSLVCLYIPGMGAYGFIIIPIGVIWMIAAGVVLLRG
ncbi:MAG: hypothetical protein CL608_10195 [Anaerolineaceae bacterium]|nr:hypothetical protein [Anaerolineaceae bacterium]